MRGALCAACAQVEAPQTEKIGPLAFLQRILSRLPPAGSDPLVRIRHDELRFAAAKALLPCMEPRQQREPVADDPDAVRRTVAMIRALGEPPRGKSNVADT
jgi:hypothetical protein